MKSVSIFVLVWLTAAQAQQRAERLADEVTTQKETITLEDLLRPEASHYSRAAAEVVSLGRAPEAGSFRMFTSDQLRAIAPSGMLIDCPPNVVVRRAGWPVDPNTVRRVLQNTRVEEGFELGKAQIVLPDGVRTRTPNAALEVVNILRTPDPRTLIAHVQCSQRSECARFVVQILLPSSAALTSVGQTLYRAGIRREPIGGMPPASAAFLVQAGRRAVLVVDFNNLKITQLVIPLKRGRAGDVVRVTNPTTHRVLVAEVVGPGLLRPAKAAALASVGVAK
jgi:hypothetical protein